MFSVFLFPIEKKATALSFLEHAFVCRQTMFIFTDCSKKTHFLETFQLKGLEFFPFVMVWKKKDFDEYRHSSSFYSATVPPSVVLQRPQSSVFYLK